MSRYHIHVQVLPWEGVDAEPSRRENIRPWQEPCSGDLTISELQDRILTSFEDLYRNKGKLDIHHVEDGYECVLRGTQRVGECFDLRTAGADPKNFTCRVQRLPPTAEELQDPLRHASLAPESSARPQKRRHHDLLAFATTSNQSRSVNSTNGIPANKKQRIEKLSANGNFDPERPLHSLERDVPGDVMTGNTCLVCDSQPNNIKTNHHAYHTPQSQPESSPRQTNVLGNDEIMIPDSPAENTRLSIADRGDMHGEYGQDIPKSESPELGTTIYSVPPSNHGTPAEDEELQPTGGRDLFLKPSIPASKFPSTKLSASVTPSKQLKNFDVASQFVESESKPDGRLKRPSRPVVDDSPGQKYRKSPSVKRPGRDVFDPITSDIEYSQESPFNQGFRKPSMGSLIETASKQSIERNRRTGIQKLDAENSQILYTTGNANGKHLDKRAGTPAKSMQHDRVDNTKKKSVKDKTPLSIARTPVKATTPISKMTPAQKLQDKADRKAQDIAKRLAKALEKERASEETINLHPIAFSGSDGVRKSSTPLIPGKNSRRTPGSSRKRIVNGMPSRATTLEVQVPLPNGLLNGSRSSSNSLQRSVSFVEDQKSSDEGMGLGVETKVLASEDSQLLPMENSEFRSSSSNELSKIHEGIIRRTPSKDLKTGRTQPIMKSSAAMVQTKLEVITNKGKGRMEDRSTFNDDTRVEDPLEFRESNGTSPAFTRGNNEDTLIQHAGAAAFDMDTVPEKVEIKANKMSSSGEKLEHGPSESLPDAAPIRDSRDEDDAVQSDEPMVAGEESSRDASEPVFEKRSVASASRSPARIVIPSSTGSENEDVDEEEEEDEDDDDDDDENDSEDEDEDEDEGYKDEDQDEKVREADTSNSRVGPEGEPHSDQEEPETLKATVLTNGHRSTIDADGILPSTEPSWNLAAVTNELATSKSDVPEAVPAEPDLSSQSSSSEEDREDTTEEEGKDHNVNKQKPDYETESDSDGCIKGDLAAQQLHRESRHCNELSRSQTKNVLPTAIGQHDRSVVGASPLAPSSTVLSSRGQPRPVNSRLPSMSEMKQRGVKVGNTTQTTKLLSPFSSSENGARSGITPKVAGHSKSDDSSDSEEDSDPEDSLTGLNKVASQLQLFQQRLRQHF